MQGFKKHLEEKLKASDDMGTWVKDFQDSDAPQFKGKSQKKRQQMAVAAKLSAERNEEVELDEISDLQKDFISSMQSKLKKRSSLRDPNAKTAREEDKLAKQLAAKAKMKKEEVELDEVLDTPKAMDSYKAKAKYSKERAANSAAAKILRGKNANGERADHSPELKTMAKREKGLKMADKNAMNKTFKALRGESVEQFDEAAPKMKGDFIKIQREKDKAHADAMGRHVKSGRKKTMTSTQRSLASMRNEEFELDQQTQYDLVESYLLENNIDVDTLSVEQLDEIIGKVVGGAFKLGAKAAVGAARRMSTAGRADAAEKRAAAMEKKNKDRERIKAAQKRLRAAQQAARS